MRQGLRFRGTFRWVAYSRSGWFLREGEFPNGVTTEGLTDILDGYFRSGGVITPYVGLIDNSGYDTISSADTLLAHAGWSEIAAYSQGARPAWAPEAAAAGVMSNAAGALFTFTADKTVRGAFIASDSTKGGTAGVLWCTGVADAVQGLASGESLRLFYNLEAAGP